MKGALNREMIKNLLLASSFSLTEAELKLALLVAKLPEGSCTEEVNKVLLDLAELLHSTQNKLFNGYQKL